MNYIEYPGFWRLDNIDLWLMAGVVFSVIWLIYKAKRDDNEDLVRRVEYLEKSLGGQK